MADCLAECLKTFGAEAVVMGGNIAESFELFKLSLEKELKSKQLYIPFKVKTKGNCCYVRSSNYF